MTELGSRNDEYFSAARVYNIDKPANLKPDGIILDR